MLYGKKQEKVTKVSKKTKQGQGRHSKPSHGRKLKRGQG